jgi:dTDP-4-amino-4,6-dideoxy-D-galactose acyltransferase
MDETPCKTLEWDTNFFGFKIARLFENILTEDLVNDVKRWCINNGIICLYFLANSDDAMTTRLAEKYGLKFVDIRLTYKYQIKKQLFYHDNFKPEGIKFRSPKPCDLPSLKNIARGSYTQSRFYFDNCFSVDSCSSLYQTWIEKSCNGYCEKVIIAEVDKMLVGYITCHLDDKTNIGQIGLVGVNSNCQGKGIGSYLVHHAVNWFVQQDIKDLFVVTQGRNIKAQRLYQKSGFLVSNTQLWYHWWMV